MAIPLNSVKDRIEQLGTDEIRNNLSRLAFQLDTRPEDRCADTWKNMLFLLHGELARRFRKKKGSRSVNGGG